MKELKIIYKTLDEIMPYERNPRNNENAIEYVANSIKEFGFKQPIVIDAAGVIVAGHTRYQAAKSLGLEEVPCIMADDLDPYQVAAYRLADNKVAEFSGWDFSMLESEIVEIEDSFNLADFGFDVFEETTLGLDDFFEDSEEKEKESKTIICPHCGEEIEI